MNELQVMPQMSLIENMDIEAVKKTIAKVKSLQATLKSILVKGHDYDTIPGCGEKETLLKPGAEKILMALGLTSTYELVEHTENFKDKGFFAYTVKCILFANGSKITEGLGHANSKEAKWGIEWVAGNKLPDDVDKSLLPSQQRSGAYGNYTVYKVEADANSKANTILKMAKKRAQIDAVLTVASLSEIFTQDFDDLDIEEPTTKEYVEKVKEKTQKTTNENTEMAGEFICSDCGATVSEKIHNYSMGKFGKALCYQCQQNYK